MSKISKRILNKDIEERIFGIFWRTISQLQKPEEVKTFFKDLLSPSEQIMLAKRLAIAVLLSKSFTYSEIDDVLKVSRPTIMNVSLWLKHKGAGYKKAVETILKDEKKEEFLDKIEELLLNMEMPAALNSSRYQSKQQRGRELYYRKKRRSLL